jgi:hypothetical protein
MAKSILRRLQDNEYFYLHDGSVIKSFEELPKKLKEINEDLFRYHVNPQTNDFANWIRFLSDDLDFIARVQKILNREEFIKAVEQEISNVKGVAAAVKKAQMPVKPQKALPQLKKDITDKIVPIKKKAEKAIPKKATIAKPVKKAVKKKSVPAKAKQKKTAEVKTKKKSTRKRMSKRRVVGFIKDEEEKVAGYLTSGIKEYLLGMITGLILGLIIGSVI